MSSRGGTPDMTPEQESMYLQIVKMGMWPSQAARKVGLTPQAISNRKRRDPAFRERCAEADTSAELALLACVVNAAKKDWRAALAIMERRWKSRWGKPESQSRIKIDAPTGSATAANLQQIELLKQVIAQTPGLAPGLVVATQAPVSASPAEEGPQ